MARYEYSSIDEESDTTSGVTDYGILSIIDTLSTTEMLNAKIVWNNSPTSVDFRVDGDLIYTMPAGQTKTYGNWSYRAPGVIAGTGEWENSCTADRKILPIKSRRI